MSNTIFKRFFWAGFLYLAFQKMNLLSYPTSNEDKKQIHRIRDFIHDPVYIQYTFVSNFNR